MPVLIDGYNVLFALALIPKEVQPGDLQRARLTLLDMIKDALGEQARDVTVVFDADGAPPGAPGDYVRHGITVHFAKRKEEADDLIEKLIHQSSVPKKLTVVSSDFRLRQAAERRGARAVRSEEFLEWLDEQRSARRGSPVRKPESEEKPPGDTDAEDWLRAFGQLDDEPSNGMKPLTAEDFPLDN